MRFYNYITLLVAVIISACAAYYSIVGLTSIFAAAFLPIVIMGSALELGKLTAAVWLHLNWNTARWWIRLYMVPAVALLMVITSMGIFGFLSKAHIEQTASAVDYSTQISQLDVDIGFEKQNIENNNALIAQLDRAVSNLQDAAAKQGAQAGKANARESSKLAEKAVKLRNSQVEERASYEKQIEESNTKIADLTKKKLELQQSMKKIEAEVGPIKYVAAMVYGDNPDVNTLERAVRWMIILLVVVFDPLAVVLILAATSGLSKRDEPKTNPEPIVREVEKIVEVEKLVETPVYRDRVETMERLATLEQELNRAQRHTDDFREELQAEKDRNLVLQQSVDQFKTQIKYDKGIIDSMTSSIDALRTELELSKSQITDKDQRIAELTDALTSLASEMPETQTVSSDSIPVATSYGTSLPYNPTRGHTHLRTDTRPFTLIKWNGRKWISINRERSDDIFLDDPNYVNWLASEIADGRVHVDDLTAAEASATLEKVQQLLSKHSTDGDRNND